MYRLPAAVNGGKKEVHLMRATFEELCEKEVINICDGRRLGHIDDLQIELCDGRILAIIVPGPGKLFGLLRGDQECVIPYCKIVKFGEDVILVDLNRA